MEDLEKVTIYKKTLKECHIIITFLNGMVNPNDICKELKEEIRIMITRLSNLMQ